MNLESKRRRLQSSATRTAKIKVPRDLSLQPHVAAIEDARLAAEAVVDAALICHRYRMGTEFTEQTRTELIDAVCRDPLLTSRLFNLSE